MCLLGDRPATRPIGARAALSGRGLLPLPRLPWAQSCSRQSLLSGVFLWPEPGLNLAAEAFIPAGRAGRLGGTHMALFLGSLGPGCLGSVPAWLVTAGG